MQLTKEQLIDAHEQGSIINTRNGNIKIVAILGDVYGVNHCDTNSKLVKLWMFENFERNQATIEQHKPKYNGRAVKCDTVEQANWLLNKTNFDFEFSQSDIDNNYLVKIEGGYCSKIFAIKNNYEIISFSQYCTENGIKEPKWIQGIEVKDGYNEIVSCSNDNVNFRIDILKIVYSDNCQFPFTCVNGSYRYARYPRKEEINEIKFSN